MTTTPAGPLLRRVPLGVWVLLAWVSSTAYEVLIDAMDSECSWSGWPRRCGWGWGCPWPCWRSARRWSIADP
ncbi:hypothetical protein [Catenulispora yoronensis]